ncbi:MAG: restriction endonuclease subunit S, partial [Chthoniobacterales bacterium]
MSFPRYPSYKDSGVEWIGEFPANWDVKKFRYLFRESPEKIESEIVGPMLSVSGYRGIEVKEYDDENRRRSDEDLVGYRIVRPGQLVVNSMWLNFAGLGVSAHEGHVSPAYRSYWIGEGIDGRFAHHLLRCGLYVQAYTRLLTGIRPNSLQINRDDLMDCPVLLPPSAEQTGIADFLERETGKIDELVAEQRRLMELLKEKRQAVISRAVTRGLNLAAPLKPSGIEWLGDVPAHWPVSPVKYVAKVGNGSTPKRELPEYWGESGFPWLNSSVVNSAIVTEAKGFVTGRALRECHLPIVVPPAVLVGITGQGRTRGMASMLGIEATINQHVAYVKPTTAKLNVDFLLRTFEMAYLKLRRDSEEAGATKGAITCEQIGNLSIPFPPLAEQQA